MIAYDFAMHTGAVEVAKIEPCAACPWFLTNQGKRHPGGWYTKKNLARLWAKLRRGDGMTCHPTDPQNEVPEGLAKPSENATTYECAGAIILQQREVMWLQRYDDYRDYRRNRPMGLLREGLAETVSRVMFGGINFGPMASKPTSKPNLNAPVGYEPLGEWDADDWTRWDEEKRAAKP